MKKTAAAIIKETQQSLAAAGGGIMDQVMSMIRETGAIVKPDTKIGGFDMFAMFNGGIDVFYTVGPAISDDKAYKYIDPIKYLAAQEGVPAYSMRDIPIKDDAMLMKFAGDIVARINKLKDSRGWSSEMELERRSQEISNNPNT